MRCGAWYTPPERVQATSYFKSTDGHMHQWDFSLKRTNLHLVEAIQGGAHALTGCLVVDSTRRGKRFPDALSKTVPIWCAVLNHASHRRHGTPTDVPLHVASYAVSASERAQIEARIGAWVDAFLASDWDVPCLTKPLQPLFVHPGDRGAFPPHPEDAHHIVLVSASAVDAAPSGPGGAHYVQGAGDDHESWAHGLTPDIFWRHRAALLAPDLDRGAREARIQELVAARAAETQGHLPWMAEHEGDLARIGTTRLVVAARPAAYDFRNELGVYALVVHCTPPPSDDAVLRLGIPEGKRGLGEFTKALPRAVDAITHALAHDTRDVLLACTDGCHASGALAIAVLAASYSEDRVFLASPDARTAHRTHLSKDATKRRLQWVVSASPRISPSRAYLQRVNAYLIGPHRQWT